VERAEILASGRSRAARAGDPVDAVRVDSGVARVRRVQRQPQGLVQGRSRDFEIRTLPDLLLPHGGQVHPDGEHVGVRGQSSVANGLRAVQVGLCGADSLHRRGQRFGGKRRSMIGANDVHSHLHLRSAALLSGHLPGEAGGGRLGARLAGVPQRLIHRHQGLEVTDEAGVVQPVDAKIVERELPLVQQAAEHEHGVIAALDAFRIVDFRQVSGPGLVHASAGGADPRLRGSQRRMLLQGDSHGLGKGQRFLRVGTRRSQGRQHKQGVHVLHGVRQSRYILSYLVTGVRGCHLRLSAASQSVIRL
jgi:hypothetical protein